jgi:hypothetical protein
MENIKGTIFTILGLIFVVENVYTIIEGFLNGKIKSYSRGFNYRFFGQKPGNEYSLDMEPGLFWFEVAANLFWIIVLSLGLYFLFFR